MYTIVVTTVIIIFAIAVVLVLVADRMLMSQHRKRKQIISRTDYPQQDVATDEYLNKTIVDEISEVVSSKEKQRELGRKVSNVVTKEVEKKVESAKEEMEEKYNEIIAQKSQSEAVAWKKYRKTLSTKKETEAVIRSIAQGLVVVNPNGKVVMMNPTAEKLLGTSKKDKIGKSILENLKKEELVTLTKESSDGGEEKEIEIISKDDETKKILKSSSAVIENEDGQTVGMVSMLSDVTKQRELDEMKENFVSNVTHELRTPLVAVQKSITMLLDKNVGQITEDQQNFLSIASRNLEKLSKLIDNLLDLSKLEAGKVKLELKALSIGKVITESVESLSAWAKSKSIEVTTDIQAKIPKVDCDPDKLSQVLNNLIGNAIKFTPTSGNITISAGLDKNTNDLKVTIADTGAGIEEEDLTKIFDKFSQAGNKTLTGISGTGIGLSVAKEIVELHGGKIWAEAKDGGGAKFTFTLPIKT